MVREHDFNSKWWGTPVGIVDDGAFFQLDEQEQTRLIAPYDWVEFSSPLESAPAPDRLGQAGFFQVDTQVAFRIGLSKIKSTPSLEGLSVVSAAEEPFEVVPENLMAFEHERFRFLPGVSQAKLNERYALWGRDLIESQSAWCFRVLDGRAVQGWFLSRATDGELLDLTLGMLKADARISGLLLYQKAMLEYAARGARIGGASFSVTNTPVLNIYATLGARFLIPRGYWIRWGGDRGGSGA